MRRTFLSDCPGGISVSLSTSSVELNVRPTGWSTHELALFSRAAKLLSSGGLRIETDYGLTDEGEPWLVFCNADSGDVCGHFAKMRKEYVACIPFREHGLKGWELRRPVPIPAATGHRMVDGHASVRPARGPIDRTRLHPFANRLSALSLGFALTPRWPSSHAAAGNS